MNAAIPWKIQSGLRVEHKDLKTPKDAAAVVQRKMLLYVEMLLARD